MKLSEKEYYNLVNVLEKRFAENMHRHTGMLWHAIEAKLTGNDIKINALIQMENTGGEPGCPSRTRTASSA